MENSIADFEELILFKTKESPKIEDDDDMLNKQKKGIKLLMWDLKRMANYNSLNRYIWIKIRWIILNDLLEYKTILLFIQLLKNKIIIINWQSWYNLLIHNLIIILYITSILYEI